FASGRRSGVRGWGHDRRGAGRTSRDLGLSEGVARRNFRMANRKFLRTAGVILLAVGAVAALGALVVRDQMSRHRRDLFSPHPLRRLAALGYLAGHEAT